MAAEALRQSCVDGLFEFLLAAIDAEQRRKRGGEEIAPLHVAQFFEAPIGNDRMAQLQRVAVLRRLFENIALAPDVAIERHHQIFANRIDRGIGHLRKGLLEIIEQQLRLVGKTRKRRVDAHRADRLFALHGRGMQNGFQILVGVAEGALAHEDGGVVGGMHVGRAGKMIESDLILPHPLRVGLARGELLL